MLVPVHFSLNMSVDDLVEWGFPRMKASANKAVKKGRAACIFITSATGARRSGFMRQIVASVERIIIHRPATPTAWIEPHRSSL